ncbi:hypothetical protein [Flavimarina sp. Hel_I_48]|uniref:hypothetical protein n=1 Tax=Flavimarina sp. Hel_I_48 TaxID=1392488 RepID=UPI0004DF1180|nr:hypothetical protein [Flavimarina sp. Hel_I_48]
MKKIILIAVFAMGILSSSATAQEKVETTQKKDLVVKTMQVTDNFEEIDKSQLPQTIKDVIMTDMDGMKVTEAYVGENSIYKIIVADLKNESKTKTVYLDADGNWIKPE